ncbi:glycoside hydrolase family 18 protein, partial [Pelomonas sp. KK5]|uniref:glycoside hydrolase family 18 protein n=1 Tax=Pelomonas sp. KK5 TaxID=1855730 RepID=UPI001E637DF6
MRHLLACASGALLLASVAHAAPPDLFAAKPLAFERAPQAKVVGVYVPSWEPAALLDRLQPGSVSHLLYAFARICGPGQLEKDAAACTGQPDFTLAAGPKEAEFDAAFQRLKQQRLPQVKVLASVGGWGGSDPFFHIANDPARRAVFAASVQRFLREHPGFDGVDIDWEHPGDNGAANGTKLGDPADGQGYAELMDALREAVDALGRETGRRYLVTTAVNPARAIVGRINFRQAAHALDLVFMMSYDFYGPWTDTIGNHTGLMPSAPGADDSVDSAVRNFVAAGVPASKLVAGVAMYGRGFAGVARPATGQPRGQVFPPGGDGS